MKKACYYLIFLAGAAAAAALPPAKNFELTERPIAPAAGAAAAATPAPDLPPSLLAMITSAFADPEKGPDGFWKVNFNHLSSFDYAMPGSNTAEMPKPISGRKDGIPAKVRELDGRSVRIEGYMMPIALDKNGSVKEFLIIRNVMSCCYGTTPRMNEWLVVKMTAKAPKVDADVDTPLVFFGKLHVGEVYRDSMLAGIYELDCEKVTRQ